MKNSAMLQKRENYKMIESKKDYIEYITSDAKALGFKDSKPKWGGKPCNLFV